MEFSIDSVIGAINTANSKDPNLSPEERNDAVFYIDQWAHSDEAPSQAMQILSDGSLDENYKFYAAGVFRIQSSLIWGNQQFGEEESNNLRDQFYSFFEESELENDNRLLEMILDVLVIITLYEFPQDWDIPSSFIFADISTIDDDLLKSHYYHFIAKFLSSIDKSHGLITPARVQYFRNLFLDNFEYLYGHINACLADENLISDGLQIFNSYLQWATFDQVCDSTDLFHDLCSRYVFEKKTRSAAIDCLRTVFTSRYDSSSFAPLSPLIIYALGKPTALCENKQHITTDQDVLNFLLRLLTRFLPTLLTVYGPDDSNRTESIRNSMIEAEIGPDELREAIVNILGVIVSIDDCDLLTEEYWAFWITIFHNVLSELKKGDDEFKPTLEFIGDFVPDIRESLYQCVPLDNLEDLNQGSGSVDPSSPYNPQQSVICTNRSRSAWSLLAKIDPEGTLAFLKEQEPSEALCYAIANLEFCSKEQFDISLLSSELNELYDFANSSDPEPQLFIALLFCFSHTLTIEDGGQFFINFIEFATRCVNEEDPPISTAGTNALFYALKKSESEFLNEQYVTDICDNCQSYLLNLLYDDAVRMFKIASRLVSKMSSREQIESLYEKMAEPLVSAMDSDYQLEKLFECIKESSSEADSSSIIFMSFVWPKLLEMTDRVLHTNPPTEILEGCLDAVATALGKEPYDEDKTLMIFSWMFEKVQNCIELGHMVDDAIYKFIGYVRSCFIELNVRLPDIISSFVEPVFSVELGTYSSVMWMLSEFQFSLFDFDWFVPLAIESILSYDKNDNINGLHCTNFLISKANTKDSFTKAITVGAVPTLLTAVFSALTDTMHKETIQYYIRFIKTIMERGSKFGISNNQDFIQMFVDAIAQNVQEPEEGLFVNFIGSLQNSINRPFNFSTMISDFLILIKKISPNDIDAFKFKKDDPSLSGDGGNVIRFDKDGQAKETVVTKEKHFRVVKEPVMKGF